MGKSSAPVMGYWYQVLFHLGLSTRMDALLEFRGGDQTAWSGQLTASGTISVHRPNLWGGEKDQGGIVGDFDVMFGDVTQQPNDYLVANLGSQVAAWRGLATFVSRGARYGAMNPYPQKPSLKFLATKAGWDDIGAGTCWYPEKCEVPLTAATVLPSDANGWEYQTLPDEANPGYDNLAIPTSGWLENGQAPFGAGPANGPINTDWPNHTILWIRRTVNVNSPNQKLIVTAENGCVVFINGAVAGAVNRDNAQIVHNENNSFEFDLAAGQSYEIAVKAFDEAPFAGETGDVTYLTIQISAPGLTAMNPAHILYYARCHPELCNEAVANINDASFRTAADWFYSQGIGLCTEYDPGSESPDKFIQRIEKLCACASDRSPVDGQWYLDIANGVYDLASLPILTDDDILDFSEAPSTLDDAVNSVAVQYFDPQIKDTVTTPPVIALALVTANGENPVVNQHNELPTGDLATRFAQRELQEAITPTRAFDLTTNRKPYSWRRNTYFRLQTPKRGIADMVCILAEKSTGQLKSGAIKLTAAQDVYSMPATSFVQVEPGVDTRPPQIPLGIMDQAAFEAPYVQVVQSLTRADLAALPSDVGYVMAVAKDPATSSKDYTLTISSDGGSTYADNANGPWCPSALIVEGDTLTDAAPATAFTLSGGTLLSAVVVGQAALWDGEIVRVDALDTSVTPNTITLGRGCADTVPQAHAANSRIWFYDGFFAGDSTEYTSGEAIDVKLLTNTGTQQLDPSLATPIALTFDQRQVRPYPPAAVQVNGQWYPSETTTPVTVSFSYRDRLGQADQLVDYSAASVGPEAGVTYTLRGYIEDTLDTTVSGPGSPLAWAPSAGGNCRIDLVSVRDGIESNVWSHSFTQAAPWTPASLFVGGTGGAWFDPSDFSTLFQDTAGTTPVTAAGQSVARMLDKSGNGHHATQATPANCPTIQQDGSGNWYLSFNGSQYLDCGTGFNADQFSCGVAYQWTGSGSQRLLDVRGTGAVGAVKGWCLKTTDPNGDDGFVVDDGTQYITSNHTTSTGTNHVFYGDFITPSALRYELEGGAGLTTVGGSTLGSTTSTQTSRIGAASNNATQTLTGRVYGIIVVKKAPSTTEIANMRAWCASKSGVTL